MKKSKLLAALAAAAVLAAGGAAIAGCGGNNHKHTFDTDNWGGKDATGHWHLATCDHDVKGGFEAHNYGTDGKAEFCVECNYSNPDYVAPVYTITLEVGDGTLAAGDKTSYTTVNGKIDGLLPEPTIGTEHWHFVNWFDSDGKEIVEAETVFTEDTTIHAVYARDNGLWAGDTFIHKFEVNTGADHVQYWFGGDRIDLNEGDEVSVYMNDKLISFWISGSCVDTSKASVEKVSSATVTADASFVIYLNDYTSEADPDNWTCEFIGTAAAFETTATLPTDCKGVEITVGEEKITLYLVTPDGTVINGENAHNYQIYAWDGVALEEGGSTEPFGAWATNPTLNKAITAGCGIVKTTSWKLHWNGGETSAFSGLVAGKAYVVTLKLDKTGDCEILEYTGEADILEPYTPEENPDVDPAVDTREFFIKGAGKSPALDNWGAGTKMTKAEDKNEYTITVDLYVGDAFKIATGNWSAEFGPSSIEKEVEETAYFGGTSNIECLVEGKYTFTLTTDPTDASKDTLVWERIGDAAVIEETVTHFYIKGTAVAGGWEVAAGEATELTAKEGEDGVYERSFDLVAGALMFYSQEVGKETGNVSAGTAEIKNSHIDDDSRDVVGTSTDGNIIIENAGTYTFTYNSSTKKVTITFTPAVEGGDVGDVEE